jgi:hypothetical protein
MSHITDAQQFHIEKSELHAHETCGPQKTAPLGISPSSPCNRLSIGWHSRWQRNHFVQANEHFTRHKLLVLLNERTGG